MNLQQICDLYGYGTSEGAVRGWDTRGRGRKQELSIRARRALATHIPITAQKRRLAVQMERRIAKSVLGMPTGDNHPFDILIRGKVGLEVKTILEGSNDKVTIHPESLRRKQSAARRLKLTQTYTIAVDLRSGEPKIYYHSGLGSFRLTTMTPVAKFGDLRKAFL